MAHSNLPSVEAQRIKAAHDNYKDAEGTDREDEAFSDLRAAVRAVVASSQDAPSPVEGSPAWRSGIEACIRKVKYRQSVMPDLQQPAYRAALDEVLVHLEAMLAANVERTGLCVVDGGAR